MGVSGTSVLCRGGRQSLPTSRHTSQVKDGHTRTYSCALTPLTLSPKWGQIRSRWLSLWDSSLTP